LFFEKGYAMKKVQLRTAFSWICPECSIKNFTAALTQELTDKEREFLEAQYGPLEETDFDLVRAPRVVHCSKCKVKFETYNAEDFSDAINNLFSEEEST
jgi:hypothetical protein